MSNVRFGLSDTVCRYRAQLLCVMVSYLNYRPRLGPNVVIWVFPVLCRRPYTFAVSSNNYQAPSLGL